MLYAGRGLLLLAVLGGCSVKLVSPYNADLAQQASSMQAEVASWDLTMRHNAGTLLADPRQPDIIATLNNWRGEGDAMLTLAISDDPNTLQCAKTAGLLSSAIQKLLPADLQAGSSATTGTGGCEATIVAGISTDIDNIETALGYCKLTWVPDDAFTAVAASPASAAKQTATAPSTFKGSCLAEFKVQPGMSASAADAQHGRAVSGLLNTLQTIVYIEKQKQAAATAKLGG